MSFPLLFKDCNKPLPGCYMPASTDIRIKIISYREEIFNIRTLFAAMQNQILLQKLSSSRLPTSLPSWFPTLKRIYPFRSSGFFYPLIASWLQPNLLRASSMPSPTPIPHSISIPFFLPMLLKNASGLRIVIYFRSNWISVKYVNSFIISSSLACGLLVFSLSFKALTPSHITWLTQETKQL